MSQLPGGLELEKQRRKIHLIEVWGLFLAAFYVVTGLMPQAEENRGAILV